MINAADIILKSPSKTSVPLHVIAAADWGKAKAKLGKAAQAYAEVQGFKAASLATLVLADSDGKLARVLVGAPAAHDDPFALGAICSKLPPGAYHFAEAPTQADLVALGWCLELYKYDPFRPLNVRDVKLACPEGVDRAHVLALAEACFAVRDRVNAPSNLFGPDELEAAARKVAKAGGAKIAVVTGAKLAKEFPLVHTVGAASTRPPRLIDFSWGNPKHPKVTLVGKGVCFDTGGLDIKPSTGMLLMKKDMGGASNVLGLGAAHHGCETETALARADSGG